LCASKIRSLMSVSESFTVFVYKRAIFLSETNSFDFKQHFHIVPHFSFNKFSLFTVFNIWSLEKLFKEELM
jgi:hypothetical protein